MTTRIVVRFHRVRGCYQRRRKCWCLLLIFVGGDLLANIDWCVVSERCYFFQQLQIGPTDLFMVVPRNCAIFRNYIRLINQKGDIDYFSKGPNSNRTDRTQKRRSFRVNLILSFHHNDKHETQHVRQLISIKRHIF
jgi:hypothetical protein